MCVCACKRASRGTIAEPIFFAKSSGENFQKEILPFFGVVDEREESGK